MFPRAEQLALPAFPRGLPAAPFSHSKGSLTLAKTHCHLRARQDIQMVDTGSGQWDCIKISSQLSSRPLLEVTARS